MLLCLRSPLRRGLDRNLGSRSAAVFSATAESLLNALACPGRELGAVGETELDQGMAHVALNRSHRELELSGDRLVRETLGHQARNLELAGAQSAGRGRPRSCRAERKRDRGVDAEARSVCPQALGVTADCSVGLRPDALEAGSVERRELAPDPRSNGTAAAVTLRALAGSRRARTPA